MTIPLFTKDGYRNWLDCPVCTEPCRTIAPFKRNSEHPYPWWEDGMSGKCQCGAELEVEAEDGRAWFVEVQSDEPIAELKAEEAKRCRCGQPECKPTPRYEGDE